MSVSILQRRVRPSGPSTASSCVFLFPGQSSVDPGAVSRAHGIHSEATRIVDRARAVLGATRIDACLDPAGAPLACNRDVQVTVFLATQMYLAALAAEGIYADQSLGLSLGEYSHLVDIGALDFDAALRLVDERGRCYDRSPVGTMVTVLAVDHDTVAAVVEAARVHGPIVISNYNAPTQHVIAGAPAAVAWASTVLEDEHAAHTATIERRVPMHSPLMQEVASAFAPALEAAAWRTPSRAYWPNVTAAPLIAPAPADFVSLLTRHVAEPVLWRASIDTLAARHPDATFVEIGPGGVLHNMLGRAWRGLARARTDAGDTADPRSHFAATVEALRA